MIDDHRDSGDLQYRSTYHRGSHLPGTQCERFTKRVQVVRPRRAVGYGRWMKKGLKGQQRGVDPKIEQMSRHCRSVRQVNKLDPFKLQYRFSPNTDMVERTLG